MEKLIVTTADELSNLLETSIKKVLKETHEIKTQEDYLPELLNITQAAKFLDLAKQTIYGFTSKGEIPYLKKGKKLYFKKNELLKWINDGRKL